MDPRLGADRFMQQLFAVHNAEDAFAPMPEDADEEQ